MKKYDIKIDLEIKDQVKIVKQMSKTTDEEVIADIIETLVLKEYQDMNQIKQAEEIILYSQLEYKVKEILEYINDEIDAAFNNKRAIHDHLREP